MKKSILSLSILLACAAAHATNNGNNNGPQNATATANPTVIANPTATANPTAIANANPTIVTNPTATGGNALATTGPIANTNTNVLAPSASGGQATAINGPNTNINTANGGAGGQGGRGGDGGNASILGSGNSSSNSGVVGSGNSSNLNANLQGQGQQQVANGGVSSSGASSTSGAVASNGPQTATLTGGTQAQDNRVDNTVVVQDNTSTVYEAQKRNPVSTAYAAPIAPTAMCALAASGGLQLPNFGITGAKAYIEENCQLLEQVRTAATVLHDPVTGAEMMCDIPAYKAARARVGRPCGAVVAAVAPAVVAPAPVAAPRAVAPAAVAPAAVQPAPVVTPRAPRDDRGAAPSAADMAAYQANLKGEPIDARSRARAGLPPLAN